MKKANIVEKLRQLKTIYMEFGPPLLLQSEQGSEFKGDVKRLCRKMQVKMIHSRPYHPQSQGRVERSHRALRSKMEYDLLKMGKKGVNWSKALPEYQNILNHPKEVLRYKSPFQIYFARKSAVSGHGVRSALPELLPFLNILLSSTSYTYKL